MLIQAKFAIIIRLIKYFQKMNDELQTPEEIEDGDLQPNNIDPNSLAPQEVTTPQLETSQAVGRTMTVERLRDLHYLPSREEVFNAFNDAMGKFDVDAWRKFMFENENIQELLTTEYINALTDYLIERLKTINANDEPVTILELGAGNGRLSHFIREGLKEKGYDKDRIRVVATDERAWNKDQANFPVELSSENLTPFSPSGGGNNSATGETTFNREVLEKHKPNIVITSWPPSDVDFTADIRNAGVEEYLIIGQEEACGDDWNTFGLEFASPEPDSQTLLPPFETDGYSKSPLDQLSQLQITRSDDSPGVGWSESPSWGSRSRTQSFKRTSNISTQ